MKSSRIVFSLSVVSASLLLPTLAFAQSTADKVATDLTDKGSPNVNEERPVLPAVAAGSPAAMFGDKGQITLGSETGVTVSTTSTKGADSTTTLTLHPAVDYFFVNNISVGGFLGIDYAKSGPSKTTTFGIGPRVGYNITFSERWSFWPKLGFSYTSSSLTTEVAGVKVDTSGNHVAFNIFAPVMLHPVKHFFLGFGPAIDTDLSGDAKQTTIAGRLTFGGWF